MENSSSMPHFMLNQDINTFIDKVSDKGYQATFEKVQSEMNSMSELAMLEVSKKNMKH